MTAYEAGHEHVQAEPLPAQGIKADNASTDAAARGQGEGMSAFKDSRVLAYVAGTPELLPVYDDLVPSELEHHPLAALFPLMTGPAFEDLCADIAQHGLREPIVLHQDLILDGRNRLAACIETGTEPVFREWEGTDPIAYVLSANLQRRHLSDSQRAMVAARVATMNRGRPAVNAEISVFSQGKAGEMLSVSPDSIQFARKVIERGTPDLVAAVDQGQVAVSQAAKLADESPEHQLAILEKVAEGTPVPLARRELKTEALQQTTAFPEGKHRVLYGDPPWLYGRDLAQGLTGSTSARDHYPPMSIAELCDLRDARGRHVRDLAMDDAVLFLWVPMPLLEECFPVIRAWGFIYKTAMVWDKVGHHFGHYVSSRAELLLICTKGSCTPDVRYQLDNVVAVEKTDVHSQKPERFREIIDELYPYGPRIDLFARGEVPKPWRAWGNEALVSAGDAP